MQFNVESPVLRLLLSMACIVIVVAGLKAAEPIIVPLILAIFIAILVSPAIYFMNRRGVPTILAIIVVMGIFAGIVFGMVNLVGASVRNIREDIPRYQEQLSNQYEEVVSWTEERGIELPRDRLNEYVNPTTINNFFGAVVQPLGKTVFGIFTNTFVIVILIIFILLEASTFPDKIRAVARDPDSQIGNVDYLAIQVFRYFAIKTGTSLATGLLIWVWLLIFGVEYALLWGMLAFLLNYIPNIGSLIAAIPVVLLALITEGPGIAFMTGVGYLAVNNLIGSLLEPRIMGDGLGLSPLVVFLSLIFWGWVFGPIGMFLSAPLTMTAKIILQTIPETRWIAVLLSGGKYVRQIVDQKPEAISDPEKRAAAEASPPGMEEVEETEEKARKVFGH